MENIKKLQQDLEKDKELAGKLSAKNVKNVPELVAALRELGYEVTEDELKETFKMSSTQPGTLGGSFIMITQVLVA
ncbi:MAG: Nif11-like leader peptide family natural product precursor [Eubacteriales bacterium]|nr:Nif11-like leader peptide family natural product precursor [Eubacteriales bacterium]